MIEGARLTMGFVAVDDAVGAGAAPAEDEEDDADAKEEEAVVNGGG